MSNVVEDFIIKSQDMGVHELRNYARELGVTSPTTKKRAELIKSIVDVLEGRTESKYTNMGRPAKSKKFQDSYNDIIKNIFSEKKEPTFNLFEITRAKYQKLTNCCSSQDDANYFVSVKGLVKKTSAGDYFFKNLDFPTYDGYVFIEPELREQYNLEENCYVVGKAIYLEEENLASLVSIEMLNNGVNIFLQKHVKFFHNNILSNNMIKSLNVLEGKSTICEFENKTDLVDKLIATQSSLDDYYRINLSLDLDKNTLMKLQSMTNGPTISSQINDSFQTTINLLNDAYNHAMLMYNCNKKVILNLIDLTWIISNLCDFSEYQNKKFEVIKVIEKFLDMSVCNDTGGSITVIAHTVKNPQFENDVQKLKYFCS